MDYDGDDARGTELETLEAIFPEIRRLDANDPFIFQFEMPVEPVKPVMVTFPAAETSTIAGSYASAHLMQHVVTKQDSQQISYLPSLSLRIALPEGYPSDLPPQVKLSTEPQWLSPDILAKLEDDGQRLWEEAGHDMIAYTYIDHLQRAAEDVFGTATDEGVITVDSAHKLAILDYDTKAKQSAFARETFDCGICLEPKKGSKCYKMLDCGHIFCLQCLQDFYNDAIREGRLDTVRCLMPNCSKERAKAQAAEKQPRKTNISTSPSELLQIGLSEEMVKRYVTLKYKTELEADKDTIYCPRQWCSGAARSKKHRKPSGLDFHDSSELETDEKGQRGAGETSDEAPNSNDSKNGKPNDMKFNRADLLSVCEDCGFAFCSRCLLSWHGEFVVCRPKRGPTELTEEEQASLDYINVHTSPCPTCNAPAQKSHGCNHMLCSRCNTHFCYLCSAWLDPSNPYRHYTTALGAKITSCYGRLWELEEGDGDDVGLDFRGGRGDAAPPVNPALDADQVAEEVRLEEEFFGGPDDGPARQREQNANQRLIGNGRHFAVAREAPLVLRLIGDPPPAAVAAPGLVRHEQDEPQRGANRGGQDGMRGGARGGRGFGRRGRRLLNRNAAGPAHPEPLAGGLNRNDDDNPGDDAEGLDAAQQAWVRQFVQMALLDEEDQIEGDSDDENNGNWRIR